MGDIVQGSVHGLVSLVIPGLNSDLPGLNVGVHGHVPSTPRPLQVLPGPCHSIFGWTEPCLRPKHAPFRPCLSLRCCFGGGLWANIVSLYCSCVLTHVRGPPKIHRGVPDQGVQERGGRALWRRACFRRRRHRRAQCEVCRAALHRAPGPNRQELLGEVMRREPTRPHCPARTGGVQARVPGQPAELPPVALYNNISYVICDL